MKENTKLKIPYSIGEDVFTLFSLLLQYDVKSGMLEVDLASLDKDKQESLREKLTSMNISYTEKQDNDDDEEEADEVPDEESEELNLSNTTYTVSGAKIPSDYSKTLEDILLFHILSSRRQKAILGEKAQKYQVTIDLTERKINISGQAKDVNNVYNELNKICRKPSTYMSINEARCLKNTNYVRNLVKRYNETRLRFISETPEKSRLIIFGYKEDECKECLEKINRVVGRVIILMELTKDHEVDGEFHEILKYLQDKYQKKYEDTFKKKGIICELGTIEANRPARHIIYFFVKCNEEHFAKIRDYMVKEIRALCILNIYPKSKTKLMIEKPEGLLDEKISVIPLKNEHYLILGKQKNLRSHLKSLFTQSTLERDIDFIKLRLKKLPKVDSKSLAQDTPDITPKPDPFFYTYMMVVQKTSQKIKCIVDVLTKFDRSLSETNSRNELDQSQLNMTEDINSRDISRDFSGLEETKTEDRSLLGQVMNDSQITKPKIRDRTPVRDQIRPSPRDKSPAQDKTPIQTIIENERKQQENPPYSELNRNKTFFMLDNIKELSIDPVEPGSSEYERLLKLLKQATPGLEIVDINKTSIPDLWESYVKRRNPYSQNEVYEYLLFLQSEEAPEPQEEKDVSLIESDLVDFFNPTQHKYYKDEETNVIMSYIALFNKNDNKIMGCYPAYCIEFTFNA